MLLWRRSCRRHMHEVRSNMHYTQWALACQFYIVLWWHRNVHYDAVGTERIQLERQCHHQRRELCHGAYHLISDMRIMRRDIRSVRRVF
jgi:hypothetical protein